jgi:DNA-binding NarL/FixJ family response regulator
VIRVLIADDQELIRAGFRAIVETQPDMTVIGEAGDGQAALDAARSSTPDVVLMDIRMPGLDGISASGFLLKNAPRDQLFTAIRTVAAGEALLAPTVTRRIIEAYVATHRPSPPVPALDQLSAREKEVLTELARGQSNAEIGKQLYLSEATVKTHVASLLSKLRLRDRAQAIVYAYESGFTRVGTPPPSDRV